MLLCLLSGCSNSKIADPKKEQLKIPQPKQNLKATLNVATENVNFNMYLPALMFHYIKDVPLDSADQLGYKLSFSPKKLEQFLIFFSGK